MDIYFHDLEFCLVKRYLCFFWCYGYAHCRLKIKNINISIVPFSDAIILKLFYIELLVHFCCCIYWHNGWFIDNNLGSNACSLFSYCLLWYLSVEQYRSNIAMKMKKGLDVSEHIIFKIYTSSGLGATLSRHFLSKIKNTAQKSNRKW